jgi:hypothetical protein
MTNFRNSGGTVEGAIFTGSWDGEASSGFTDG